MLSRTNCIKARSFLISPSRTGNTSTSWSFTVRTSNLRTTQIMLRPQLSATLWRMILMRQITSKYCAQSGSRIAKNYTETLSPVMETNNLESKIVNTCLRQLHTSRDVFSQIGMILTSLLALTLMTTSKSDSKSSLKIPRWACTLTWISFWTKTRTWQDSNCARFKSSGELEPTTPQSLNTLKLQRWERATHLSPLWKMATSFTTWSLHHGPANLIQRST